jgi:hypothetical protein
MRTTSTALMNRISPTKPLQLPSMSAKYATLTIFLLLLFGGNLQAQIAPSHDELARLWDGEHISRIDPTLVRHADLKNYLEELRRIGVKMSAVGRSGGGREIYQMEFGRGPYKVFLWSQMHGDEPTATSSLIDLFAYLQRHRDVPWVRSIEEKLTLRAVPMLNPDGAEVFQRRNLQYIDINRDAHLLTTPEGRLLKKLRDEWSPQLGFNLHNQNPRTAVGDTGKQATISLLAVAFDEFGSNSPARILSKKVCAVIHEALSPFIYGQIGRYDDTFNPRAFGDLISKWGTQVILIETGGWHGHTEMELVRLNFIALAASLRSLADGSAEKANPGVYDGLRYNTSGVIYDLIVRQAMIVNRGRNGEKVAAPYKGDVGINLDVSRGANGKQVRAQIQEVGDLSVFHGFETIDASDYYLVVAAGQARPSAEAALLFYRRAKANNIDWNATDLETKYPPDAVFRAGVWQGNKPGR